MSLKGSDDLTKLFSMFDNKWVCVCVCVCVCVYGIAMKSVFLRVVHDQEGLRNNYSRICPRGGVGRLPGRPLLFQKWLFHFTFPSVHGFFTQHP